MDSIYLKHACSHPYAIYLLLQWCRNVEAAQAVTCRLAAKLWSYIEQALRGVRTQLEIQFSFPHYSSAPWSDRFTVTPETCPKPAKSKSSAKGALALAGFWSARHCKCRWSGKNSGQPLVWRPAGTVGAAGAHSCMWPLQLPGSPVNIRGCTCNYYINI